MPADMNTLSQGSSPFAVERTEAGESVPLPDTPYLDYVLVPVLGSLPESAHPDPGPDLLFRDPAGRFDKGVTVLRLVNPNHPSNPSDKRGRRPRRLLLTILMADVEGYCRLMHADDTATVECLNANKRRMARAVEAHGGWVVDAPGDSLMAAFPSVTDGVQCAMAMQERLRESNLDMPHERKMLFRIAIHLGDVISQGRRLYGDAVNIAARLEALADPGGVFITRAVHEQVAHQLKLRCEYLGERRVKNLPDPISAYRVLHDGAHTAGGV